MDIKPSADAMETLSFTLKSIPLIHCIEQPSGSPGKGVNMIPPWEY